MSEESNADSIREYVVHAGRTSRFVEPSLLAVPPLVTGSIAVGAAAADHSWPLGLFGAVIVALGVYTLAVAMSAAYHRGGAEALEWMSQRYRREHLRRLGIDPDRPLKGDPQAVNTDREDDEV